MHHTIWFRGEKERRALTGWCGTFAAFGWVMLEGFFELFFGPHVGLMRSLAIGSGIGAATGLITSSLQWLVVHGHVRNAGVLIPATTAGSTIAGLGGGLLLNAVDRHAELYYSSIPLQGAFGAIFVGLTTACAQWVVLREWVMPGYGWSTWLGITAAGLVGGTACACAAVAAVTAVLNLAPKNVPWHIVVIVTYLAAAVTGGTVYGRIVALGLRRVLPEARLVRNA